MKKTLLLLAITPLVLVGLTSCATESATDIIQDEQISAALDNALEREIKIEPRDEQDVIKRHMKYEASKSSDFYHEGDINWDAVYFYDKVYIEAGNEKVEEVEFKGYGQQSNRYDLTMNSLNMSKEDIKFTIKRTLASIDQNFNRDVMEDNQNVCVTIIGAEDKVQDVAADLRLVGEDGYACISARLVNDRLGELD